MFVLFLSSCLGATLLAQTPHLLKQSNTDGIYCSNDWKIGGKIHFDEGSSSDYIGTIAINKLTRKIIRQFFDIHVDSCANNAKALLKKENSQIILTHREERSKPGVGEELHATLLYTNLSFGLFRQQSTCFFPLLSIVTKASLADGYMLQSR